MSHSAKTLIAGLGSAHGDDQAGWLMADTLTTLCRDYHKIVVRRAMIPLDVLDWLGDFDTLHICDACEPTQNRRRLHRFSWDRSRLVNSGEPADSGTIAGLPALRSRGTHDFGLPDVLRLAMETGPMPKRITIWAIEGSSFQPGSAMSEETRKTVELAVAEIASELRLHIVPASSLV